MAAVACSLVPRFVAASPLPEIVTYSSTDIGADAMSFSVAQAPDGTLVFGGNTLLTFDGQRWTNTAIPGAYGLRGLAFDPDGKLWVGGTGELGWCERRADGAWIFHSLRSFLPEYAKSFGAVWYLFAGNNGIVFFTEERVLRWNGREFQVWTYSGDRRLPAVSVDGTIYFHYIHDGLLALRRDQPETFISSRVLGDARIMGMEPRGSSWLLITSKGLFTYEANALQPFAAAVSAILQRDLLTSIARLPDGSYAFGTLRGGIVRMDASGNLGQILTEDGGLPTQAVTSLFVDRDGTLWGTSRSNIFRVELGGPSTVFDVRANLPTQAYRSIAQIGDRIIVGSESGGFEWTPAQAGFQPSPLASDFTHDIRAWGKRLLVSGHRSAKLIDGDQTVVLHSSSHDIFAAMPSRRENGTVLLSDNRTVVAVTANVDARVIVKNLPDIARTLAEDDEGNLWLGTMARGVLVAQIGSTRPAEPVAVSNSWGLPALRGRCFVRGTQEGAVFVFADDGGWIKPAGSRQFQPIDNYPLRAIGAVSDFDSNGIGWVAHLGTERFAASAARIRLTSRGALWEPHSVAGLGAIGSPRSILAESGSSGGTHLWIGGTRSVLRNEITSGLVAPVPAAPKLRALAWNAKAGALQPLGRTLPYNTRSVHFEFSTQEIARRPALRLETRIDGIDRDWVPAGGESRRELTALRDAKYRFAVRTVAETGVTSEPTVLEFVVLPPWWRTGSILACVALALGPCGYGIYWLRVRTLRRRNGELEKRVRERTAELERANAAKTQFVANMSHDIRNPLNGIVGLALALEDTRLDHRQREIVATLRECTTYLSSLVDDVLDFASIEAGRVELRPVRFAPHELLRSIVETLKADTAESGALLTVERGTDVPPYVVGDAGRVQQILVNFVSNALKYAGGHIHLAVRLPENAPGEIEFSVRDEGAGLSEAEQALLFTKFSRLKQTSGGEEIPGTGLGLAACRLLADIMGGAVGVESQSGAGSRFFLRLPLTVAEASAEVTPGTLPNTTVLLVEDTDYNAWAATAVLAKLGLSCVRARTGAEALELFAAQRFNVVLLDRNLPDMDGIEVARRMRELETDAFPAILLAVTAYCTAEDRLLCLKSGMDAFVGKPLTPEKVRKVLLAASRRLLAAASVQADPALTSVPFDLSLLTFVSDGSEDGLEVQVERFLESLAELRVQLERAAKTGTCEPLAAVAHDLLGQAKLVGASALVSATLRLQTAARQGDSAGCDALVTAVDHQIRLLTAAMRHRPPAVPTG